MKRERQFFCRRKDSLFSKTKTSHIQGEKIGMHVLHDTVAYSSKCGILNVLCCKRITNSLLFIDFQKLHNDNTK